MNLKILIAKTVTIDGFYDFADGEDKAAEYEYDAMGRLTADHNKDIRSIQYNVLGLPSDIWAGGAHARYTYDADGTLLCRSWGVDEIKPVLPVGGGWGSGDLGQNPPEYRESSRREWCGDFEYADGAFERMRHSAGWLGADGRHTAEIKDYQGNVRATWTQGNQKTTNPAAVEKGMWYDNVTGYYPYGLPWASMQGQESRLYSGKKLDRMHALNLYDFHARLYDPQLGRFLSPDPCSTQYEPLSPYLYCAANPILLTDPTGCLIEGVTKNDAVFLVADMQEIFSDDAFTRFRDLIKRDGKKQNGKRLAQISPEDQAAAFAGIELNEDQQALVDIAVNTINSKDRHYIEYVSEKSVLSWNGSEAFSQQLLKTKMAEYVPLILEKNNGLPFKIISALCKTGATAITETGSHTVVVQYNFEHPFNRAVTTGHELFGHGRSRALGRNDDMTQHVDAVRMENLILRVMKIPAQIDGKDHAPLNQSIPNPSFLPDYR